MSALSVKTGFLRRNVGACVIKSGAVCAICSLAPAGHSAHVLRVWPAACPCAPLIFDRSCRLPRSSFCPAGRYCLAPRRLYLIRFYRTVNAIRLLGHKKWALEILDQREVFVGLHVRCPPIPAECGPARRRYIIISARYTGNAHYICTAVLGSAKPPAARVPHIT